MAGQAVVNKTTDRQLPGSHRVVVSTVGDVVAVSQSFGRNGCCSSPINKSVGRNPPKIVNCVLITALGAAVTACAAQPLFL